MWSPTEGCIFSLKVGKSCLIPSMISIVLVPGWRWMARRTVRDPLYQAAALSSCTLSSTRPTCSSRTGAPFRYITMRGR